MNLLICINCCLTMIEHEIELALTNNSLVGTIPTELGVLDKLEKLWLNDNSLTRTIPSEIWLLTSLVNLNFSENSLSGTIPPLPQIPTLKTMRISANKLTGTIPPDIFTPSIERILIGKNYLTGTIPTEIGNLSGAADRLLINELCLSGEHNFMVCNKAKTCHLYNLIVLIQ